MGQTLSEPVTAKETTSCENNLFKVGSSSMQGWRINMEDAHTQILSTPEDKDASFFAVYDGHGGSKIANYVGNHLHKRILQCTSYSNGHIEEAIKEGFLLIDDEMIKNDEMKDELAGTTAVVVFIRRGKIYCGNVGDSRAVASVDGLAEPLSFDHKPANELEARRIIAAGGWVEFNRVNGNLALSRALGDFIFKRNDEKMPSEQIVTAFPDVLVRDMSPDVEFLVLACDGIWDVLSNQEVVDFCRDRLSSGMLPETVCEELLSRCLAPDCQMGGLGCDNMTVVLVCLLQNLTWDEYKKKLNRPRPPSPQLDDEEYEDSSENPPPQVHQRVIEVSLCQEAVQPPFVTPPHSPKDPNPENHFDDFDMAADQDQEQEHIQQSQNGLPDDNEDPLQKEDTKEVFTEPGVTNSRSQNSEFLTPTEQKDPPKLEAVDQ